MNPSRQEEKRKECIIIYSYIENISITHSAVNKKKRKIEIYTINSDNKRTRKEILYRIL